MNENTMEYKGYTAVIQYSAEDECLVGEVAGIADKIGFHADSVEELRHEFKISIDSYLAACKKLGEKPNRPSTGKVVVHFPFETFIGVSQAADATGQSIDELVVSAVQAVYPYSQGSTIATKSKVNKISKPVRRRGKIG